MEENKIELEKKLGYLFQNKKLLDQALVHPSWVQEQGLPAEMSNERLEFLGDSALNLSIASILYKKFPLLPEGLLSKARANLISRACMTRLGASLGIGEWLTLAKGEEQTGGRTRPSSLGNAMEAIFGAIFLEAGFEVLCPCVERLLHDAIEDTPFNHQLDDNPKGELQEFLVGKGLERPVYECIGHSGPPHKPIFECRVLINGKEIARASSQRRQSAESACAREVLRQYRTDKNKP